MSLALPRRSQLLDRVTSLAAAADIVGPFELSPVRGGNNNQIYRLETPDRVFAVKLYFSHRNDGHERLHHEFDFVRYAWGAGVRMVPEPYAADPDNNVALYEFVAGDTVNARGVTAGDIDAAIGFYHAINAERRSEAARRLSAASEAAFSIADHLRTVDDRIARLHRIEVTWPIDEAARQFVAAEVVPLWADVREAVRSTAERHGVLTDTLTAECQCLSPSDFGFHNAIAQPSGAIRFLDFEYAGWDDPAKLACDFANQPDNLLRDEFGARFRRAAVSASAEAERLDDRITWLTPVYQVKWTCIVLNVFSSVGKDRHRFAAVDQDLIERKTEQFRKARVMLGRARLASTELRQK